MKKLFKGLILLAMSIILTSTINAQDIGNVLSVQAELRLDGIKSEFNMFHIVISDDENNEIAFDARQYFSFDLNLGHSYTVIINSKEHTSKFIIIDTYGNIKNKLEYKIEANLIKFNNKNDIINVDTVQYNKEEDKFLCVNKE